MKLKDKVKELKKREKHFEDMRKQRQFHYKEFKRLQKECKVLEKDLFHRIKLL